MKLLHVPESEITQAEYTEEIQNWIDAQVRVEDPPAVRKFGKLPEEVIPYVIQMLTNVEFRPERLDGKTIPNPQYTNRFFMAGFVRNEQPVNYIAKLILDWYQDTTELLMNDVLFFKLRSGGFLRPHSEPQFKGGHYIVPLTFNEQTVFGFENWGRAELTNFELYNIDVTREHAIYNNGPDRIMMVGMIKQ